MDIKLSFRWEMLLLKTSIVTPRIPTVARNFFIAQFTVLK